MINISISWFLKGVYTATIIGFKTVPLKQMEYPAKGIGIANMFSGKNNYSSLWS